MVTRALAALGAALFGLLLAARVADGSYGSLVQGWYRPVLIVTAALLLGLAAIVAIQTMRGGPLRGSRTSMAGIVAATLTAIPIGIGFAYQPQPLGSESFSTFEDEGQRSLQFSTTASTANAAERNVYQWAYEFATADPASIIGDSVDVTGFVYHAEGTVEGRFEVARFVVACCVADARGYTLPVRWHDAASLPGDSWVRVHGRVGTGPDGALIILAEAVDAVGAPANPYIYP